MEYLKEAFMVIRGLAATLLIAAALMWLFYSAPVNAESRFAAQNGWERQAERELFLPQGMAGQLMTQGGVTHCLQGAI